MDFSGSKKTKYDSIVIYNLLNDAKHPLLDLKSQELRRSLVYTIANIENSHWVALEACLATKRIVIYDPAVSGGFDLAESEIASHFISFFDTFALKRCIPWLSEPWRTRQTLGGQQELRKDGANCGIIAAT